MTLAGHPQGVLRIAFAQPLDLAASLAPLGRAGDDLIDRFDGQLLLRTTRIGPAGAPVAYAAQVATDVEQPVLEVLAVEPPSAAAALEPAIRASLLSDRTALFELASRDAQVAALVRRYPGLVPVLFTDPLDRKSTRLNSSH